MGCEIDDLILWETSRREVPPRPEDPARYPESDARRWYDQEFAAWIAPRPALPLPPAGGPRGKRVVAVLPFRHPYWTEYERGLRTEAARAGIRLEIRVVDWDGERQSRVVDELAAAPPDLVVFVPADTLTATDCVKRLSAAGVPTIASNQGLEEEAYAHVLSWTGPDDWGQHRLLARRFSEFLGGTGGYCIISHKPGTSAYSARVWGLRTELSRVAPDMRCLDVRFTEFDRERSRLAVLSWLDGYGGDLKGIVSADDSYPMEGVNRALAERGREDVVRVANGATKRGFGYVKGGSLKAVTYQSPEMDGALAMRTAVDWFSGLVVEPIRCLPAYIVTAAEVDSFIAEDRGLEDERGEELCRMIAEGRLDDLRWYFDDLERRLADERILGADYFRGFTMELLAGLLNLAKTFDLDAVAFFGGYEMLFKGLFHQKSPAAALLWLRDSSVALLDALLERRPRSTSLVDQLISYAELHYAEPIALKTIAERFGLSAAYLGTVFKERTGNSFSRYLNELRIGKAKDLLQAGRLKPKDVAKAVGFAEGNYFCAVFRRLVGVNPSEYPSIARQGMADF